MNWRSFSATRTKAPEALATVMKTHAETSRSGRDPCRRESRPLPTPTQAQLRTATWAKDRMAATVTGEAKETERAAVAAVVTTTSSEERRVGREWVSQCSTRWAPCH